MGMNNSLTAFHAFLTLFSQLCAKSDPIAHARPLYGGKANENARRMTKRTSKQVNRPLTQSFFTRKEQNIMNTQTNTQSVKKLVLKKSSICLLTIPPEAEHRGPTAIDCSVTC